MIHRALLIVLCLIGTAAFAADNTACPISGRPVNPSVTSDMDGTTVSFCCGGCKSTFDAMNRTEQQATFASLDKPSRADAKTEPAADRATVDPELFLSQVYLLKTCPVSGKPVDSMDDPASKVIGGREIIVCCPPCFSMIEKDQATYNAVIDKQITEEQLAGYPMTACLASGRPIDVKGTPTSAVYGNRLMRFCCGGCANYIIKDPVRLKKAIKTLDAATVKKQRATYPLTTCVVSGRPLGDQPVNVVIGGQLVRLCCGGCEKKFRKNPRAFMSQLKPTKTATSKADG